jgi:hypothetical protein
MSAQIKPTTAMFEDDASQIPEKGELESIVALVERQRQLETETLDLQTKLDEKVQQLRDIAEKKLPDLMIQLGVSSFKLTDGSSLVIKKFYQASISEEKRLEAFGWLRDHNHDDLIKHEIKAIFGKGEDKVSRKLVETLIAKKINFTDKESVHPSTLKAFVKEQVESQAERLANDETAEPFPMETFSVYVGNIAKIELPKK